ncbi:hypothetical protein P3X46_022423 [Hevea brasiliensis]|uniref:Uncharacterized protein n=1 Tax=Hevea brasiliensis TaxID=3981 RepID=A0ABQ9L8U7_HEVBR|nr:hypothetical protein P3X46_022423 [Hevea brasiliensis]
MLMSARRIFTSAGRFFHFQLQMEMGSSSCASGASPCSTIQEQGTAFDFTYDGGTDWEFCVFVD